MRSSAEQQRGQGQAPLLHKLLLLTCSGISRPYRQQQLPRQGPLTWSNACKGQAGVAALQSRQAALNAQLATASGQVSSSWSVSALLGLPWLVTLLLSRLSQQQTSWPAAAPNKEHGSNHLSEAQNQMDPLTAARACSEN